MSNTFLVIKREFFERTRRKSFIISTILAPVLMLGLMALPAIIAYFSEPSEKQIAVIDPTGYIVTAMQPVGGITFVPTDQSLEKARENDEYNAVLVLPADILTNKTAKMELYTHEATSLQDEAVITSMVNAILEQINLQRFNIPDLKKILAETKTDVSVSTLRIDSDQSVKETSTGVSYGLGMLTTFILYMFIMIYGQMVMTSIIEEKNNRVLEVVVSSVKPSQLMLGKVLGIGAVALTQMLLWSIIIYSASVWLMPEVVDSLNPDSSGLLNSLMQLGNPSYILGVLSTLLVFLVFGYLFYSGIYAIVGSAVDNIQDASQLQSFAIIPIILGLVFSMSIVNEPNSTLAVVLSMVPFTSPMVMMARVPFGINWAEVAVSAAILIASTAFMIWFAAKIYRVGIFMYGKKPTVTELIRWSRYK